AAGAAFLADEALIGGIVQDDCMVLLGPLDPLGQLGGGVGSAGGVVGAAQVDDVRIGGVVGHGQEVVLGVGGHVADGAACHDVVVHIDRVDRVGNEDGVVHVRQVQQIAQVALGAVGDKDLAQLQLDAAAGVILADGFPQ